MDEGTQPFGLLCLWQCLFFYINYKKSHLRIFFLFTWKENIEDPTDDPSPYTLVILVFAVLQKIVIVVLVQKVCYFCFLLSSWSLLFCKKLLSSTVDNDNIFMFSSMISPTRYTWMISSICVLLYFVVLEDTLSVGKKENLSIH